MRVERTETSGEEMVWNNGRRSYANCGIIGIDDKGEISYGYDGGFPSGEPLSQEERVELADYMIEQWTKFKNPSVN